MAISVNIPLPTLKRYSYYLNILLKDINEEWVSTSDLSKETGTKPITIRKDLGYLGVKGIPQKGYPRKNLVEKLKYTLGGDSYSDLILIGSWGFGAVYKKQPELLAGDFRVRVLFDFIEEEDKTGGIPIYPIDRLKELIPRLGVKVAILSVEPDKVKDLAKQLYLWGIKGILNLSTVDIDTEDGQFSVKYNPLAPLSELLGIMKS